MIHPALEETLFEALQYLQRQNSDLKEKVEQILQSQV